MTPQLELTAIAWALVGYVALQVALNVLSVYRVSRTGNRPLHTLVNAFQANVLNALYFLGIAVAFHLIGIANEAESPPRLWLHALLGVPLGIPLWFVLTLARKFGQELLGRGDLALAEEAIIRHAPTPRLQGWGVMNLVVIQPLAHELFLRGLLLPAVVQHKGWVWGIAPLIVECCGAEPHLCIPDALTPRDARLTTHRKALCGGRRADAAPSRPRCYLSCCEAPRVAPRDCGCRRSFCSVMDRACPVRIIPRRAARWSVPVASKLSCRAHFRRASVRAWPEQRKASAAKRSRNNNRTGQALSP